MASNKYKNPKNSLTLIELEDKFNFLKKLYIEKKFPKVLMLSGPKGTGKFTLINHFMNFVYDNHNYDSKNKKIDENSVFFNQFLNDIFPNIIHLSGVDFKNIKIDDIRDLKTELQKSTILNKERFIILDDVELFNINCLNALLKIIEEPSANNFFILVNNKVKPLIETIYSRSLEVKIILTEENRVKIIEFLINSLKLKPSIDYKNINLTPGNFLSFNSILFDNKIFLDDNYLDSFKKIIYLYKKNKDKNLINLILFLTDYYFNRLSRDKNHQIEKIFENKSFVVKNINEFVIYNLNQASLINSITNKLTDG